MVWRVVVFPAPFAPISATDFSLVYLEGNSLDCLDHSVDIPAGLLLQALPLSVSSLLTQICRDNLRVMQYIGRFCPVPVPAPKFSTVSSSQIPDTSFISCSISRIGHIEIHPARNRMVSISSSVSLGFMPAAGSSRSRSFGSVASARAISSFRCLP